MANIINNYLSPTNFTISISRIPNVEFFTQKMAVPSISSSATTFDSPLKTLYAAQTNLTYEDLSLTFIVDENMNNYKEILNWMEGLGFPEDTKQRKQLDTSQDGLYSDIIATVTNSHKNPNIRFTFKNCFPTSIGSIELDVNVTDVSYATCSVTMRYDSFIMEQLN